MSRSNPNTKSLHPAKRWFQWNGEQGNIKYYDKEAERNVEVSLPFEFVLLDKLSTIRGWHELSKSGIYSNEIRSTIDEPFTVKAFKEQRPIAAGFYQDIKPVVKSAGGKFNQNLYIAFQGQVGEWEMGSLMLHGASMNAWIDFEDEQGKEVYKKGIRITGHEEGKKGSITFRKPVFELFDIDEATEDTAKELDQNLQDYLGAYFNQRPDTNRDTSKAFEPEPDNDEIPY